MDPDTQGMSPEEIELLKESDHNGNPKEPQAGEPGHPDYVAPDDNADPGKKLTASEHILPDAPGEDGPTDDLEDPLDPKPPAPPPADKPADAAAAEQDAAAIAAAAATPAAPPAVPEIVAPDKIPDLPPAPRLFKVDAPETIQAAIDAALDKQAAAFTAFSDGGDVAEYNKVQRETTLEVGKLQAKLGQHEANQQAIAEHRDGVTAHEQAVMTSVAAAALKAGIDYRQPGPARQFDTAIAMLAEDPDNKGKTFRELADMAHQTVCAVRGVKTAPAAPAPAAKPAAASPPPISSRSVDKSQIPPTLSRVPVAMESGVGGDEFAHLDGLTGYELEREVAKMSKEQQERWLS